ncbi:MAG: phosphoribosyltransferase [Candidatus Hodarchaeota archaeon]
MYRDRLEAGRAMSEDLRKYTNRGAIVLAIPNGGVPVGYSLVKALNGKMHILIVRKIQIPWNPEAGFGAITIDGTVIFNEWLVSRLNLTKEQIDGAVNKTLKQIDERTKFYKLDKRIYSKFENETVILTDDGLASGFTMLAAIESVKKYYPTEIIVAVPTASLGAVQRIEELRIPIVCRNVRNTFYFAVADAYQNWYDVDEEEVLEYIKRLKAERCWLD